MFGREAFSLRQKGISFFSSLVVRRKERDTLSKLNIQNSKLPTPLLGPALDDDLGFGVELNAVAALGVQVTEEAFFPA